MYGFKPTFGSVTAAGVKLVAPSLDTVGLLARSTDVIAPAMTVLAGPTPAPAIGRPLTIGVIETNEWHYAGDDSRRAVVGGGGPDRFGEVDALLTASANGEAPLGLASTGDPRFARLWTLLGLPALSIPGLTGSTGLPVGVQMVGRRDTDALVLQAGGWLGRLLASS